VRGAFQPHWSLTGPWYVKGRPAGACPLPSRPQNEAIARVFPKPLDVVRSPGVVVQAEVDAFGDVGLSCGICKRRLLPQRHHRCIQRLNRKTPLRILVADGA